MTKLLTYSQLDKSAETPVEPAAPATPSTPVEPSAGDSAAVRTSSTAPFPAPAAILTIELLVAPAAVDVN